MRRERVEDDVLVAKQLTLLLHTNKYTRRTNHITMPSTVKVRIKAARNLSSLTPASSATTTATAASSGTSSSTVLSSHNKNISPRSTTNNNNSPSLLPDTHVTITLGGHSAVAEYDEDNDYNNSNNTDQHNQQHHHQRGTSSSTSNHHKRDGSNIFNFGSIGGVNSGGGGGGSHELYDSTTNLFDNESSTTAATNTRTSRCYSARTRTIRRSANPSYNEEFRFEVADDTLLQDEPLLFHVWDNNDTTTSSNKNQLGSIGLVYLDLNPLLMRTAIDDYDGKEKNKIGT